MNTPVKFAWIGLGAMGGPMAAHLAAAGHRVKGFDLGEPATREGIEIVDSLAEAARGVDAIFMTLPAGPQVRATLGEPGGVFENADPGTLIIDCSSVDLEASRWCHSEAESRGFGFVDAPMSGSVTGAREATLTFMIGGHPENVALARRYARPMGTNFIELGGPTTGMAAKLCNNMMLFNNVVAAAESVQLAMALGIDPEAFWRLANVSTGHSWAQEHWYPVPGITPNSPANDGFEPTGFAAKNAQKDLANALKMGAEVGATMPVTTLSNRQLRLLIESGYGDKDSTFVNSLVFPKEIFEARRAHHDQEPTA